MKNLKDLFIGTNMIPNKQVAAKEQIRELLDASYQGVKRLFVLAYNNVANDSIKLDISSFKKILSFRSANEKLQHRNWW